VRQTWLCKKKDKYVALKVTPNHETKRVEFEVVESKTEKGLGFDPAAGSSRGTSTCRHCGTTVKSEQVKLQGKAGKLDHQLMAIVCTTSGEKGKTYLSGDVYKHYVPDEVVLQARLEKLCQETGLTIPNEPIFSADTRAFFTHLYGLDDFGKLFTSRQLLALMTFVKWVRLAHQKLIHEGYEEEFGKVIATYLGILSSKLTNQYSSLCTWDSTPNSGGVLLTFSRQALAMVWDFGESSFLDIGPKGMGGNLQRILESIRNISEIENSSLLKRTSAISLDMPQASLDAVVTDPPYFDSVPYADLSDFFYVWLKRSIGHLYSEHFSTKLTPKKNEAIMEPSRHGGDKTKAAQAYESMMHQAFCEANRVLKLDGIMVVVYAHKTTAGWSSLIDSLRRAGFIITEAWPLDTEYQGGLRGLRASLASSIFLVARKRQAFSVGNYSIEVKPELSQIVQERVKTLMQEGVTGADLVIACIGAGLRAYTQYDRVELPNGEELNANSFLDEVQKEVVESILTSVLQCDRQGVSLVDKPTQYYIMGRYEYGEAAVEFDEANTLAKGIGIELDGASGLTNGKLALVKKTKTTVQLNDYRERGVHEDLGIQDPDGRPNSLIDILHRLLWLADNKPQNIPPFISQAQPDTAQLRLVAQALAGRALTPDPSQENGLSPRTKEQAAIDTLLASWKRLIEDNLFTQRK
jgi:putative DNA methylase